LTWWTLQNLNGYIAWHIENHVIARTFFSDIYRLSLDVKRFRWRSLFESPKIKIQKRTLTIRPAITPNMIWQIQKNISVRTSAIGVNPPISGAGGK
jgi:hypothetical protein